MSNELYLFNDNGTYHAFTPTLFSKSFEGKVYSPTIMGRSKLVLTENFSKSQVTFKFERTHSFAKHLLQNIPEVPVLIQIYRNSLPYWKGRVLESRANPTSIEISCDSNYTSLARGGINPRMTLLCRHVIYSTNCGVNQVSWASTYTGITASTSSITVSGMSEASGYFKGGIATLNQQTRHIIDHTSTTIKLTHPFTGVQTGTLKLYPGCALTEEACADFGNLDNCGCFARIPQKNPMGNSGVL